MPKFTSVELVWAPTCDIADTSGKIDIVLDGINFPFIWHDGDHWRVNPSEYLLKELGVSHLGVHRQGIDQRPGDIAALVEAILAYPADKLERFRS